MTVKQTKAAEYMQKHADTLTSHEMISLLLAGAIERVDDTRAAIIRNNVPEAITYNQKLVNIVAGLRDYLDVERGGDIAVNLYTLYSYIINTLTREAQDDLFHRLAEVGKLIAEVKDGWDGMDIRREQAAV